MGKRQMLAAMIAGIVLHGSAETDFSDITSIALIDKKIQLKTDERKKLVNDNPCVVFAEEDTVGMNVKKTMTRDKYHRSALTVINRKFYCPIHKKSERCITPRGEAWKWCKKGEFAFSKWESLRRKAEQSEANVEKIKAIDDALDALKARKEELKVMEQEKQKAD